MKPSNYLKAAKSCRVPYSQTCGAAATEYAVLVVALSLVALFAQQLGIEISYKLGEATFAIAELGGGTESTTGGGTVICEYRIDDQNQCFVRCYEEGRYEQSREVPGRCPPPGSTDERSYTPPPPPPPPAGSPTGAVPQGGK